MVKCEVMAAPRPEFTWLVNGNRVIPEPDPSETEDNSGLKKNHVSTYKLTPDRELQGAEIKCMVNGE